jgi:hypothetical protein
VSSATTTASCATYSNTASASAANAPSLTASANLTVPCPCELGYPYTSSNPRTSVVFNESDVLQAYGPTFAGPNDSLKVWYNDEHALTLGVRQIQVKTSSGTTTSTYTVSTLPADPGYVLDPSVGSLFQTGIQAGTDTNTCTGQAWCGRPLFPSLFITDITTAPTSTSGDWQMGGTPIPPSAVFGTWKAAVKTVDETHSPAQVSVTPDSDPAKNNWNLGTGSDSPTGGFSGLTNQGYGAEVRWKVSDLGLLAGHAYRVQVMVHDGDQNKSGGDAGEACMTVVIPQ